MAAHRSTRTGDDDAAVRVACVIEQVAAARLAGEEVPDEQVIGNHPDLMPELRDELSKIGGILDARRRAAETQIARHDTNETSADSRVDAPGRASRAPQIRDSLPGYQILNEIHRGGQGVVYRALQESTKRDVAIKVMKEGPFAGASDKARFDREVEILGRLKHPNIVTIHDSGTAAGSFYFVMDYIPGLPLDAYVEGLRDRGIEGPSGEPSAKLGAGSAAERPLGSARDRLRDEGKPAGGRGAGRGAERLSRETRGRLRAADRAFVEEVLRLFGKICDAVNAAHLLGIIHRDLKPGNIRVDEHGEPHILDFGLAKFSAAAGDEPQLTMTGQFVGSLPWASPEQAHGEPRSIDLRSDVYSLGVILFEMLTGRFPYEVVGNVRDVLDNILNAEPSRPSTIRKRIDDDVETIALKCLAKERERRYQGAGELSRDVHRYLAGDAIDAKHDSFWYVLRKMARRNLTQFAVAASVLVIFVSSASIIVSAVLSERAERQKRAASDDALAQEIADRPKLAGALRSYLFTMFLTEWRAGYEKQAFSVIALMEPDSPEAAAARFLLDDRSQIDDLLARLPEQAHAIAYIALAERRARRGELTQGRAALQQALQQEPQRLWRVLIEVRLQDLESAIRAQS